MTNKNYYRFKDKLIPDHYWGNDPTRPLYQVFADGNGHSVHVVASFDNEAEAKTYAEDSTEVSKTPECKDWPKVYWVQKNPEES